MLRYAHISKQKPREPNHRKYQVCLY